MHVTSGILLPGLLSVYIFQKIVQLNEQLQKIDEREAKKFKELEAQKKHFQTLLNDAQVNVLILALTGSIYIRLPFFDGLL